MAKVATVTLKTNILLESGDTFSSLIEILGNLDRVLNIDCFEINNVDFTDSQYFETDKIHIISDIVAGHEIMPDETKEDVDKTDLYKKGDDFIA